MCTAARWNCSIWPGREGQPIAVEAYASAPQVQLLLNGKDLGIKPTDREPYNGYLIYQGGIANMRYSISTTAKYGDVTRGPRIVTEQTKQEMKKILSEIQQGQFAKEWVLENQANRPVYNALLAKGEAHPIEAVGAKLRAMMPWLKKDQLVDKSKN